MPLPCTVPPTPAPSAIALRMSLAITKSAVGEMVTALHATMPSVTSFLWPHNLLLLWPLQGRPVELCQTLFHVPLTFCYQLGAMVARLPWTCTLSLPSNSSLFMKPHQLQVMPWRWVFSVSSLPTFLPAGMQEWIFPQLLQKHWGVWARTLYIWSGRLGI